MDKNRGDRPIEKLADKYRNALVDLEIDQAAQCERHPRENAVAVCDNCARLCCRQCLTFDESHRTLCCSECARARSRRGPAAFLTHTLSSPVTYVLLAAMVGLIMYFRGDGHPSPEKLAAQHSDREWFRREAAVLWLKQAYRASRRRDYLRAEEQHETARKWTIRIRDAMRSALDLWRQEPPAADLRIGLALAEAELGNAPGGYADLRALDETVRPGHPSYLPYLCHRGRLAWQCGDRAAAKADWQTVLERTKNLFSAAGSARMLDDMVSLFAEGLDRAVVIQIVHRLSQTDMTDHDIRGEVLETIAENDLLDEYTALLSAEEKAYLQPAAAGAAIEERGLHFEHFDLNQ